MGSQFSQAGGEVKGVPSYHKLEKKLTGFPVTTSWRINLGGSHNLEKKFREFSKVKRKSSGRRVQGGS